MARGWRLFSSAKPSFAQELAILKRAFTDDTLSSCPSSHEFPGLDISGYSSVLRPTPHPDFHVAGENGTKRLRIASSGGPGPFGAFGGAGLNGRVAPDAAEQATSRTGLSLVSAEAAGRNPSSPGISSRFFNCVEDPPEFSEDDEDYQDDEEEPEELSEESVGDAEEEELKVADPVQVLDSGLAQHILSFLDAKSLGNCLAVSHGWNSCAQSDILWGLVCKREWEGKLHLAPQAVDPTVPRLRAFQKSKVEAQRVCIEYRNLCGWVWEYYLKDPLASGGVCDSRISDVRKIILEDGYMYDYSGDKARDRLVPLCHWELEHAEGKSFLNINEGPLLAVSRMSNWGWKMESSWIVLKSTSSSTAVVDSS